MADTMGKIKQLQGFDVNGDLLYYTSNHAIVDLEIVLRQHPDWDWPLSVQGSNLLSQARDYPEAPTKCTWALDAAKQYL